MIVSQYAPAALVVRRTPATCMPGRRWPRCHARSVRSRQARGLLHRSGSAAPFEGRRNLIETETDPMFKISFITIVATAFLASACNHENDRAMTPANGT